jgi:hypothetical protein
MIDRGWDADPVFDPTADLRYGQRLDVIRDRAHGRYVIQDAEARPVAFLPDQLGGEVRTRTERWQVAVERRRHGWAVTARHAANGALGGEISMRWRPNVYELCVGSDARYELKKAIQLRSTWTLLTGRTRIARLATTSAFASEPVAAHRAAQHVGVIETIGDTLTTATLALPIALSLEMIKAQKAIPGADGPSP